jgi:hypothetical protein
MTKVIVFKVHVGENPVTVTKSKVLVITKGLVTRNTNEYEKSDPRFIIQKSKPRLKIQVEWQDTKTSPPP